MGMLVSKRWLEAANDKLFGDSTETNESLKKSLFYDVRPAVLASAWTKGTIWQATARFLVNDVADESTIFPVYAPTATADPGGTVETTRFFVVWRGRWEVVAGTPTLTCRVVQGLTANYLFIELA